MNLNQLELLRVLQETDFNLSKAADKLCIVQSAVSRQLQMLEAELGSPLFERQAKKLSALTELGERVMLEVRQIAEAKQQIHSLAEDFLENRNGVLHIATTHTQAKYLLPAPLEKFRRKFPGIKIYMLQSSPEKLVHMLHQHQADVVICTEKLDADDDLIVRPCYEWRHIAIVPKNHPLVDEPITLPLLAKQPILTYAPGFTGRSAIDKTFKAAGLELDIVLSAADSEVIKTYVRLGLGVGIIACTAYEQEKDLDLLALELHGLIPTSVTKIAYLKQQHLPAYCRFFIDTLLAEVPLQNH